MLRCKLASGLVFTCGPRSVAGSARAQVPEHAQALPREEDRRDGVQDGAGAAARVPHDPAGGRVSVTSRTIPPRWGSIHFVWLTTGSPHDVRPMGRTCGEPDEIKKNIHPNSFTALDRERTRTGSPAPPPPPDP